MRTIGLDVHKTFAEAAILEPGHPLARRRIATDPTGLRTFAQTLSKDDQVVLEATMNTWAITELLAEHAGRVVVSNPLRTKAIADAKVKTDKVDAQVLAHLLAADFIPEVWVPDGRTRQLRRQVAQRAALVRQQTQLRNQAHAILHRNLVAAPMSDLFGVAGRRWLAEVALPFEERAHLDATLRVLGPVAAEIQTCDQALAAIVLAEPQALRLLTLPGIGAASALAIVAVSGDIHRFPRANKLVSYLGLDPRVRQSGERPAHTGHISRQGQAHARGLLIEAAHAAVSTPGPLRAFFRRVRARRGEQVAIVAVARKLVVLSWHLLTSERDYRWARPTLVAQKRRQLELAIGAPRLRSGGPRRPGPTLTQRRAAEHTTLEEAEATYRAFVAGRRTTTDAVAATGVRRSKALEGQMRGGASTPTLRSSHGVDRVQAKDIPPVDP
jgi:transposase